MEHFLFQITRNNLIKFIIINSIKINDDVVVDDSYYSYNGYYYCDCFTIINYDGCYYCDDATTTTTIIKESVNNFNNVFRHILC